MQLPDFPWDTLAPYKERALGHPGGLVDLSVGTPVDPTPQLVRNALSAASDASGYPLTWGTAALREAVVAWFARRRGVSGLDPDGVLPTIGSKELVALLPTLLGCGPGDIVAFPEVAYPTYDVGARIAGATPLPMSGVTALGPMTSQTTPKLLWVNTPSNPTGQVLGVAHLAKIVDWARRSGVVVASDECYAELDWRAQQPIQDWRAQQPIQDWRAQQAIQDWRAQSSLTTPSILDPRVCGSSHEGLLAVYSLSKQSNLAGYRAAFVAGDPVLVGRLLEVRKHAGLIMPWPVQQAMLAALGDDTHVAEQKARYGVRRGRLRAALEGAGYRIDLSDAGLYLWATRGEDCWRTVADLADRGILVAPGSFYGRAGRQHVRCAITATDERVDAAVERLA